MEMKERFSFHTPGTPFSRDHRAAGGVVSLSDPEEIGYSYFERLLYASLVMCSGKVPIGEDVKEGPEHGGGTMFSTGPGNTLGFVLKSLRRCVWAGKCRCQTTLDKAKKMDG
ncbi:hypothetical protein WMY93_027199 [Mugilogobius chulae]|uniref:Uncharacterized protein n=1 Tax=Mugilogobius chulae TaxID=88201 RepID=A0AAW0MTB4_9GOBI